VEADSVADLKPMSLREQRVLFTRELAGLIRWLGLEHPEWEVALDEATVKSPRKVRMGKVLQTADDAVHKPSSFHHRGLAADLLLYIDGQYVKDGDHPAWKAIAERWEAQHPLCTSGRRWQDANHVSLGEGRKEGPLP
jgi:hypothetical protein